MFWEEEHARTHTCDFSSFSGATSDSGFPAACMQRCPGLVPAEERRHHKWRGEMCRGRGPPETFFFLHLLIANAKAITGVKKTTIMVDCIAVAAAACRGTLFLCTKIRQLEYSRDHLTFFVHPYRVNSQLHNYDLH